ncbi:unnamed protein product [Macrosiphum euphorbiae]|uniref:RNA-directed DNA polymerase n=1 Tax=Macrosiphum euphorbiae TaxID=13131 RepID=A0AAV0WXZ1_9HEMI|nr:unnamed protein product [Macrosiphum euphorbiae]CAI6360979.1 unnamed protein product [Macrosiphum euphorbiae]CAI6376794.1 unnamed protein product [Macrosiphum euphorbiae]
MEFNRPANLKLTGNLNDNFKIFKQEVEVYFMATETNSKSQEVQVARLLNLLGPDGLKLYNTFKIDVVTVDNIFKSLEEYCVPRKNEVMEHYKYFTRKQAEGEPFDKFYADLRELIKSCSFGESEEALLRTQVVLGINDKDLQSKLLREDLPLLKVIKYCQVVEQAEANCRLVQKENLTVDQVEKSKNWRFKSKEASKSNHQQNATKKYEKGNYSESNQGKSNSADYKDQGVGKNNQKIFNCFKCGNQHAINKCPAFGKNCKACGKLNHFAVKCKSKEKYNNYQVNEVHQNDEKEVTYLSLNTVETEKCKNWTDIVDINNIKMVIKIDTGAQLNVMPLNEFKKLNTKLEKSKVIIKAFGGFQIKSLGKIKVCISNNKNKIITYFEVVEYDELPILGLNDSIRLSYSMNEINEIVKGDNEKDIFVQKNIDIFTGLGKFPEKINIKLKNNAVPISVPPRRVPYKIINNLKEALDNMAKQQVIIKCNKPSEWQSPIIVVEKPDKSLRICLDPREINKSIVREMYQIPTLEQIKLKLSNKNIFTVLDLKDGFYHCELDEESQQLCCFSTPFGCYKFLRLPFGLSAAPEKFQEITTKYFGNIENVNVYFDDILIAGETLEEHDRALNEVIKRAKQFNIKFNPKKIQYKVSKVKFLGFIFSAEGVQPDSERIRVIRELNEPSNKKELQSFLGMVNYLRGFIPNLSEIVTPFRLLLKKNVLWEWSINQSTAFVKIKNILCEIPSLNNFSLNETFEIQTDASEKAIGCCIFQNKKPVHYASRCLSDSEINFAQVEKEMLAIVFACTKFHYLIYGQKQVNIFTDHQPLVSVLKKEINKIPNNRLRRLRVKLLIYNIHLEYLPGKYMYVADFLSRNYIKREEKSEEIMNDIVHTLGELEIKFENNKETEFRLATLNDEVLNQIIGYLKNGWPKKCTSREELKHYYKLKNEIMLENEMLYWGMRLIVPKVMRKYVIKKLHSTHLGMTKTVKKANQLFYWPGMKSEIENYIGACNICLKFSKSKIKEPIKSHEIPMIPFYKIGMDIAECFGKNYLVVIDYYSRWLEVVKLKSKTSGEVIKKLKKIFSRLGIPKIIVADNNPFNSLELKTFTKEWDIVIVTCSPNYHQSNGLAEKAVGIVKNMLKKLSEEGGDLSLYLMNYRNTPVAGLNYSPAQILQSRNLRTLVNNYNENCLKPEIIVINKEITNNKSKQINYYNRSAGKEENEFNPGDKVVIQNKFTKVWWPGIVIKKTNFPRSYIVKDANNRLLRRNSIFLKKVKDYDLLCESEEDEQLEVKDDTSKINRENEGLNVSEDKIVKSNGKVKQTNREYTRHGRRIKKVIRYGIND